MENQKKVIETLGDFEFLSKEFVEHLQTAGIVTPTSIQLQAIPAAMSGKDVLAESQTGSGKTLAFAIPMALSLLKTPREAGSLGPRAIILSPTRELAAQTLSVFYEVLAPLKISCVSITGGASYTRQMHSISRGADVVIGTPGRVVDLIRRETLKLDSVKHYVLDEVDQMLDIGFSEDLNFISKSMPDTTQTLFFSATMNYDVRKIAKNLLKNPAEISVATSGPKQIKHSYLEVKEGAEIKALINSLLFYTPEQALIFCTTKDECGQVADQLTERGFNAMPLHGDLGQNERNHALAKFREKRCQYLIATNVAARGIDISELPLVVNLNVPWDVESYTHRVGRTGRAGKEGEAWTFVTPRSGAAYKRIIKSAQISPNQLVIPNANEVINQAAEKIVATSISADVQTHVNKTAQKAMMKSLSALDSEQKDLLLRSLLFSKLKKIDAYYRDDMVPHSPCLWLDNSKSSSSSRGGYSRGGYRGGRGHDGGGYRGEKTSSSKPAAFGGLKKRPFFRDPKAQ